MPSANDVASERWNIGQYVGQWGRAVHRQRDRVVMNADADDIDAFEVDVHLYAVTLNRLANMVKWAMRHANAQRDHGLAGRIALRG